MKTKMFSPDVSCSANQSDNNSEISQHDVNYPTGITNLSFDISALESAAKRKQPLGLRKCKSESRRFRIDKMGARLTRSRSLETIEVEYNSLTRNRPAMDEEDSDDDYKLLESTEDELNSGSEADDNNCATNAIEHISTAACDGHDSAENSSRRVSTNCTAITSAGNEITNDLLCKRYSTLPRVKIKKGNVDHEHLARRSAPYKSFDNRAHCSIEVAADNERATTDISRAITESDKANKTLRSTTLPKTRSRVSEPYSRHSLRRAIDSTMSRKDSRISDASEHRAVIIPAANGPGTGKNEVDFPLFFLLRKDLFLKLKQIRLAKLSGLEVIYRG